MKLIPNNYFLILYIVLFVISPFINILLNALNRNNLKKLIILLFGVFSVYAILTDIVFEINYGKPIYIYPLGIDGNQKGYTIMNFILLYIIGALIRKNVIQIRNRKIIVVGIIGMSMVLFVWAWIAEGIGINDSAAFNYDNPIVIIIAALFFMAFKDLKIESKIINNLAQPVFMVFLINIPLLKLAKISIYANKSIVILSVHMLVTVVIIYFIGYIVYRIYSWTIGKLIKQIKWFDNHSLVIKQE